MKVIHIFLELDKEKNWQCSFCPVFSTPKTNKAIYEVYQRSIESNHIVSYDMICKDCKENYDKKLLKLCELCGLIETRYYQMEKYCKCILDKKRFGEDIFESKKILKTTEAKLAEQIHELSLEKEQLKEDIEIHLDAIGTAERFGEQKTQQELLDRIKKLEKENGTYKEQLEAYKQRRLSDENKTLKEQIAILKSELLQFQAQIEIPPK